MREDLLEALTYRIMVTEKFHDRLHALDYRLPTAWLNLSPKVSELEKSENGVILRAKVLEPSVQ
jgi:hypothetical protein